jgi:hypothetical protein
VNQRSAFGDIENSFDKATLAAVFNLPRLKRDRVDTTDDAQPKTLEASDKPRRTCRPKGEYLGPNYSGN